MFKQTSSALIVGALLVGGVQADAPDQRFMEFPNALPGKILKIRKEMDAQTGKIVLVSNYPEVSTVSQLLALEKVEQAAEKSANGNWHPTLGTKLKNMSLLESMEVWVRIRSEPVAPLDKTQHSSEVLKQNALAMINAEPVAAPAAVLARYGLSAEEFQGTNLVSVTADKTRLIGMRVDPDIASIWIKVKEANLSAPEITSLATAAYMSSVPSGAGSGVKAATFEHGLTSSFLSCIGVSATYDTFGGDDDDKRHAQAAFRALTATAPSASFYHRRSVTFNSTNDQNYITTNGIQTLSMSCGRGGTSPHSATYSEFLSMDNMAYYYPYPVFVNPAGNQGYGYGVNWQCYNAISVGNVRQMLEGDYAMAECTQTKNPPPRYGECISGSGAGCAGDREMPHIVVPGIPNESSTFATNCLEGTGLVYCGTSWSAPVGNGIAADVIAADSRLVSWPEKVRATLILTAQNVDSSDWTSSVDERDGTGTISGVDAVAFAQGHTSVSPNNTACEKGMGATSFYPNEFGSNKRFNYLVPNPKPSGKHLRAVLTWDSNPNVNNGTNALTDFDLYVQRNGGIQASTSWDSNVEVVDIAAADLTAGSSYYIDIYPVFDRIPSGERTYYAIAWAWVKDHAP